MLTEYLVAWTDGNIVELVKFKKKAERDSFIEDLKENNYSFCTSEARYK